MKKTKTKKRTKNNLKDIIGVVIMVENIKRVVQIDMTRGSVEHYIILDNEFDIFHV